MERMAAEFIPTVMSRGFHAGPVFGIFGAAVAAAKSQRLDEDQIHGAIAQCVNLAAGNLEGARSGGRSLREGGAVRNALLAVALAKHGTPGGETVLEGEAGFYHAYAGNNRGELRYSFTGDNRADLAKITDGLGNDWIFLETLYRIYSTAGYNIAHVDVTAKLCEEHNLRYEDIDRIEAVVNWLETEYPSPAFPSRGIDNPPQVGSTQYFTAWGAVRRGYPLLRGDRPGPGETDPPEVLDLMHRVTIIPTVRRTLFGPRITVFTKDGRSFTKEGTGREFIWDFEEQARRIRPITPGVAISEAQFADLIDTCRHLDRDGPSGAKVDRADHSVVTRRNRPPLNSFRAAPGHAAVVQSCQRRPRTRENSDTFAVTSVVPLRSACAAISRSYGPIGVPAASKVARRSPAAAASSSPNATIPISPDRKTRSRSAFSLRRSLRATPYQSSYSATDGTAIELPSDTTRRNRLRTLDGWFLSRAITALVSRR